MEIKLDTDVIFTALKSVDGDERELLPKKMWSDLLLMFRLIDEQPEWLETIVEKNILLQRLNEIVKLYRITDEYIGSQIDTEKEKTFDKMREQILNTPDLHEKFRLLDDVFRDDEKIVLRAMQPTADKYTSHQCCHAYNFQYASERLRDKLELAEFAVQQNGSVLKYCSERLRNHKPLVLLAVTKDSRAFKFASDTLKSDYDVIFTAIENEINSRDADDCDRYCYDCDCCGCDKLDVLSFVPDHVLFETEFIMRFSDKHLDYLKIPEGIKQLLKSLNKLTKQLADLSDKGRDGH